MKMLRILLRPDHSFAGDRTPATVFVVAVVLVEHHRGASNAICPCGFALGLPLFVGTVPLAVLKIDRPLCHWVRVIRSPIEGPPGTAWGPSSRAVGLESPSASKAIAVMVASSMGRIVLAAWAIMVAVAIIKLEECSWWRACSARNACRVFLQGRLSSGIFLIFLIFLLLLYCRQALLETPAQAMSALEHQGLKTARERTGHL